MAEGTAQEALLQGVARLFDLAATPERIEVYDNSHIQGANPYGVMVVAGPGGLPEERLPQILHPRNPGCRFSRSAGGRRLRHDARGVRAPLRPRPEGGPGARERHLARPGADRRRHRPAQRGARGAVARSASTTCRWSRSPRARTATPGASGSTSTGRDALPAPAARSRALLPATPAGRGAPLRHHHPPRRPLQGAHAERAGRHPRRRHAPSSAGCSTISAPRAGCATRRWRIWRTPPASAPPWRGACTGTSTPTRRRPAPERKPAAREIVQAAPGPRRRRAEARPQKTRARSAEIGSKGAGKPERPR